MRTTPRPPRRKPSGTFPTPGDESGIVLTPWDARGDVAVFRLPRTQAAGEAVEQVRAALALAVHHGIVALVVDGREFEGVSPDTAARHEYVRGWAAAAEGRLRAAVVLRPEYIDPEKFGIVAARNFGLEAEVFTEEDDAVRWLREGVL